MSTKTISIDMVAYERLCRARREPRESFSQVIRRARWDEPAQTGQALLDAMRRLPAIDAETLEALEEVQRQDRLREDRWRDA